MLPSLTAVSLAMIPQLASHGGTPTPTASALVAHMPRFVSSPQAAATAWSPPPSHTLQSVKDELFDSMILKTSKPLVIDFMADYCGPCRLCEPALKSLDAAGTPVYKARLDENPLMRAWLATYGYKITCLPTLVLVCSGKDGLAEPVRSMWGAKNILNPEQLTEFAHPNDTFSSEAHLKARRPAARGLIAQTRDFLSRVKSIF